MTKKEICHIWNKDYNGLGKGKDRPNVSQPDRTEIFGPSKWVFNSLCPSLVRSSSHIWSRSELIKEHLLSITLPFGPGFVLSL